MIKLKIRKKGVRNEIKTSIISRTDETFAGAWAISYQKSMSEPFIVKVSGNLLDAAYEMLCWCIENRYIKTKE